MIIIIILLMLLLLIILFLIFRRKGSYTITFDTNGWTEISNIEVKNNEIIKLSDEPIKEGYKFVGWLDKETINTLINDGKFIEGNIT